MNKEIRLNMNSDVYEKFCLALKLTNESEETVIENLMRSYIARTFEKVSQEYNPKVAENQNKAAAKDYYGKALNRIPVWALKPEQYNHKIIKAYFTAVNTAGKATVTRMEQLCSDKDHLELYVPTFKNNYSQMKLDGPKSHGKVFEDDGDGFGLGKSRRCL